MSSAKPNRLINEKSPYLLQHAHNPVDWYPWGEEAFAAARAANKPVFLSIGYSTCHWCHVMEEECFSKPETGALLKEHFISIKVDREERPDVDHLYMKAVMMLTGSGGWPMSVFLTPDKKPFYGGTYFPPEDRWGKPGFARVITSLSRVWQEERDKAVESSEQLAAALAEGEEKLPESVLNQDILDRAFGQFQGRFDRHYGGFGPAPKFPQAHGLGFLLRYGKRLPAGQAGTGNPQALEMTEKTLREMARGGIYDHLGGGFHRYSTDQAWFLPHFEKMLYDQATLARAYIEAFQATGDALFADVAREILDYVLRDMTHEKGGFYSAEDADSLSESGHKKEGAFYAWRAAQIREILTPREAEILSFYYGVEEDGNVKHDPQEELTGKNVLAAVKTVEETARTFQLDSPAAAKILQQARVKLFQAREQKPRPHRDEKILADWNGLMIAAFAFAGRVLDEERYLAAARKAAAFILAEMRDAQGRLLHRFAGNTAEIPGFLDDHAFFMWGLLELYEADFAVEYLEQASRLSDALLEQFYDRASPAFFLTSREAEVLLARPKDFHDGAVPSGNAVAVWSLLRLARMTGNITLQNEMEKVLRAFSGHLQQTPAAYAQMLMAVDFYIGPVREIVLAAEKRDEHARGLEKIIFQEFIPNKVVLWHGGSAEQLRAQENMTAFLKDLPVLSGQSAVYICENYACQLPARDENSLKQLLRI